MKPRNWEVEIAEDSRGRIVLQTVQYLNGPRLYVGERLHVREVLPDTPDSITITREQLEAAWDRAQSKMHGLSTDHAWSALERELFGAEGEG